jgi:adenylate cyclase
LRDHEPRPSIAVLPFRKLVLADESYFADGFVDNIIHSLAALKQLFVIARASTLNYATSPLDVRAIGAELGVRYVLYGSIQRIGSRVRVGTELSDAETGEVIRSDHYDDDINDLFDLQDKIAEEVVKVIEPRIRKRELARALRKHPQDMNAYDLVLQALELLDQLEYETFSGARGLLERAMTLDPTYSPAFSYAAWWHSYRIGQEWSEDVAADAREAARLAEAAIERDDTDALALAVHGHLKSFLKKDFSGAIESLDRALSACPNSAIAWTLKGATLCFMGDGLRALQCASNGLRLSPRDKHIFFAEHILAQAHYINGDLDEAILWSQRAEEHNGRLTSNLRTLIASLIAVGRTDEARAAAQRHQAIAPRFSLRAWAMRSPMRDEVKQSRVEMLREAGLPE